MLVWYCLLCPNEPTYSLGRWQSRCQTGRKNKTSQTMHLLYPILLLLLLLLRLAKCHKHYKPGLCKIVRVRVNCLNEHMVFWSKFNLLSKFGLFFKVLGNEVQWYFKGIFVELLLYVKGILMILSIFYCILSLTLLSCKFGIAKNDAFFGWTRSAKISVCGKKKIPANGWHWISEHVRKVAQMKKKIYSLQNLIFFKYDLWLSNTFG